MKASIAAITVFSFASLALPASADVSGHWRVVGKVSSFAFTLYCDFKPDGARLGGVCVDTSTSSAKIKAGQSHVLIAGTVSGDRVSWTYRSSFLLSKFDVTYRGTVADAHMNGTIDAQGHGGTFTANRQ